MTSVIYCPIGLLLFNCVSTAGQIVWLLFDIIKHLRIQFGICHYMYGRDSELR